MKILLNTLYLSWMLVSTAALAEGNPAGTIEDEQDAHVVMRVTNPERDVGYTVGDILSRTVTLEVKKPYVLQPTSLPIVGYEKRQKGQVSGIELREISTEETAASDKTTYILHLSYQVFTNNIVAKPAILPPEFIKFNGGNKTVEIRIPSWSFRISPLAVYGSVKIEKDMSPFRGPLLLDSTLEKQRLWALLAIFGISSLGLLYVLGASAWLPRMGGPFARACRELRKLPLTDAGLKQGLTHLHEAFNTTAGNSVFNGSIEKFIIGKPGFTVLKEDIEQFFKLSDSVFFALASPQGIVDASQIEPALVWLRKFCRRCRDCERGLK